MKTAARRLSIMLLAFIAGIAADYAWHAREYELTNRLGEFNAAFARKDVGYLRRTLPDDFRVTRIDDSVLSKAEFITHVSRLEETPVIESIELRGGQVRINGERAVIAGLLTESVRFTRPAVNARNQFLAIYTFERREGIWFLVSARVHRP